jgi:hypothetical protein
MELSLRDLKFQKVENVKNWVSRYFWMQMPEIYSEETRKQC